ncbi:hypothetical protein AB0B12_32025 [Streptomyces sp. NPDC044780]|uniref:hypothetical protein n=1 Tax=unclassified Streptomyces TaxID=2593676 RepID=UPI0033F74F82
MTTSLDTLVTALYVKIDDERADLARLPGRPPKLSHSELLCLAVMQAMPDSHCEARWLRHVRAHYRDMFPFIPQDSGYNKRLRAALPQIARVIRVLAHGGRTAEGVAVRVAQRVLALAAAIRHNLQTGQAVSRSLNAYGHLQYSEGFVQ